MHSSILSCQLGNQLELLGRFRGSLGESGAAALALAVFNCSIIAVSLRSDVLNSPNLRCMASLENQNATEPMIESVRVLLGIRRPPRWRSLARLLA